NLTRDGQAANGMPHQARLQRAVDWLLKQCRQDGFIAVPSKNDPTRDDLLHHAVALQALAEAYGDETNPQRRDALKAALQRGVAHAFKCQTADGGWLGPRGKMKQAREDLELSIAMLHALREARNMGLPVAKEMLTKAKVFIRSHTSLTGGLRAERMD